MKNTVQILIYIFVLTTILLSCNDNKDKLKSNNKLISIEEKSENEEIKSENIIEHNESISEENIKSKPIEVDTTDFLIVDSFDQIVFENGSSYHFLQDSCSFYYECDCCAGLYIFNEDSTFYSIDYCMSDESIRQGKYSIDKFNLKLQFDKWVLNKKYNEDYEKDLTAIPYFYIKKEMNPIELHYFISKCGDKIKLTDSLDKFCAVEVLTGYKDIIEQLTDENLILNIN